MSLFVQYLVVPLAKLLATSWLRRLALSYRRILIAVSRVEQPGVLVQFEWVVGRQFVAQLKGFEGRTRSSSLMLKLEFNDRYMNRLKDDSVTNYIFLHSTMF